MLENEAGIDTKRRKEHTKLPECLPKKCLEKEWGYWQTNVGKDNLEWVEQLLTWPAYFCHIPCVLPTASSAREGKCCCPTANPLFCVEKPSLTKCTQKCPLASFLEPQGTMQNCLVTMQLPSNCLVLFGALVWQVSLFDWVNSPGITFSFIEKQEGWNSPLWFRRSWTPSSCARLDFWRL